jgi:hypothetical protein
MLDWQRSAHIETKHTARAAPDRGERLAPARQVRGDPVVGIAE